MKEPGINDIREKMLENRIEALENVLLNLAFQQNVEFGKPITREDLKDFLKEERIIEK